MVSTVNNLIVKELVQRYQGTRNCLVVGYQGIKSLETNELRKDLRTKNIHMEVVKNTLASLAFEEISLTDMKNLLEGPSAIVIGPIDPVVLAKTLVEWSKKMPSLKVKGGVIEGRIVSYPEVETLSKLPSKPVLYTQMVTLLQSPLSLLARTLSAPLYNLRGVIEAFKNKKEKESTSTTGG
ncbi:MAG TPA: 50S ribosomal protein L10 [Candidatus Hypogeohydataceae bacterium YC41]